MADELAAAPRGGGGSSDGRKGGGVFRLRAGNYQIQDPVPAGVTQIFAGTSPQGITLTSGQKVGGVDFGNAYFGTGYVPEPSSLALVATSALLLLPLLRRRRYIERR